MKPSTKHMLKIGIIKEGKVPPDNRVPLGPRACRNIMDDFPVEIKVQSSPSRAFADEEYNKLGITVVDDVSDCDLLMGVKEVKLNDLIDDKTYFFFSHTIKKQAYNKPLIKAIIDKKITLIDYEVLADDKGRRVIAFGRFAGMVGAHNALMTYGRRTRSLDLKRMKDCKNYSDAVEMYQKTDFPAVKIVLTGTGRVGSGAKKVLDDMGIAQVSPEMFLTDNFDSAVYCQLTPEYYVRTKNGDPFIKSHYYDHPEDYISSFTAFTANADIFINGIYWDNLAPPFFTIDQMKSPDFKIQVIADVTCDIAPKSSVPSTIKASTIADPIFGFDPRAGAESRPHLPGVIDMMTVDNLPNELPRDASRAFGRQFIDYVLPELLKKNSAMIHRATITRRGKLGPYFGYLDDYIA